MSPVDGVEAGGDGFGLSATLEWIKMVAAVGGSTPHRRRPLGSQCNARRERCELISRGQNISRRWAPSCSHRSCRWARSELSAPALAGCGISNYQNLGGVHSATAQSGVHTATSKAPTASRSMSSCPTANAIADRAGASPPRGHAINAHGVAGNSRGLERATADGNSPHAGAVHTANLKKAKE